MSGIRRIDICVCTFRRPQVAETLRSLASLTVPRGYVVGILVADNDDEPSAREIVAGVVRELELSIRYIHCPARNISVARNACLDSSNADLLAFIDDDEIATPDWIARLVEVAEQQNADVVLGPVRARYAADAPGWMRTGDFHSTFPVWVRGQIRTGYTCNVLLRRAAGSVAAIRFSLGRGQTGGEDTEFFTKVFRGGGTIAFAKDAWVEEPVPAGRATWNWLVQRRLRVGQTHGHMLREQRRGIGLAANIGLACAKAGYCIVGTALTFFHPVWRNRNLLRGIMHAGVVGGLMGVHERRQYGVTNPEAT